MLQSVSWLQYIQTVLILLVIYYPALIVLYYRNDVMKYFTHGIALSNQKINTAAIKTNQVQPAVHELMYDLKTVFKNAAEKKIVKEELIMMLQNKIKEYPAVKDSEYTNDITKHIAYECGEQCNIMLSDEELRMLW